MWVVQMQVERERQEAERASPEEAALLIQSAWRKRQAQQELHRRRQAQQAQAEAAALQVTFPCCSCCSLAAVFASVVAIVAA